MANPCLKKIHKKIEQFKSHKSWRFKTGAAATAAIMVLGGIWWLSLPLPQNYETEVPVKAGSYSVTPVSCDCQNNSGCRIQLKFYALEPAQETMPEFKIEENTADARTIITFDRVSKINREFDYREITASPLIDSVDYNINDQQFVIEIRRKGAYLPAEISVKETLASILLPPATADFPIISNQIPANDSAAFPALRLISFDATLKSPFKSANIIFQGKAVEFETAAIAENSYRFSFRENLEIDKEYSIKAIIADIAGRTTVASWKFYAQIPSAVALGKDRFKYLGWWGEVNANGVTVRKGIAISSDKLGTLSSANRVKVIKEVYGDWVDGKNLWYQIDGGMYAGAYVFSDFITPMAQPIPPANLKIPEEVGEGEKWIDVDLSKRILTLLDYDKPIFATYISPGREENPTRTGTYRVWYKLMKAEMRGGPPLHKYRYHLKNIPWTMYYNYDYAIHGTYWHDKFGMPQSAGCTNMTQGDAKYIFDNTLPAIPEGEKGAFARKEANKGIGTGTVVHNHE